MGPGSVIVPDADELTHVVLPRKFSRPGHTQLYPKHFMAQTQDFSGGGRPSDASPNWLPWPGPGQQAGNALCSPQPLVGNARGSIVSGAEKRSQNGDSSGGGGGGKEVVTPGAPCRCRAAVPGGPGGGGAAGGAAAGGPRRVPGPRGRGGPLEPHRRCSLQLAHARRHHLPDPVRGPGPGRHRRRPGWRQVRAAPPAPRTPCRPHPAAHCFVPGAFETAARL